MPRSDRVCLHVCTTCTASSADERTDPRHGQNLFDQLVQTGLRSDEDPTDNGIDIVGVECLSNCKSGCSVALNGEGKWGYVYGHLDPETSVEDILNLARAYRQSENGIVPWRERPEGIRRNVIARIPPLPVSNCNGEPERQG